MSFRGVRAAFLVNRRSGYCVRGLNFALNFFVLDFHPMRHVSAQLAERLPFFYGYVMLPVSMLMQIGTSPGQTFAISAFTPSLLSSLDLTESRLALAYMLGTVCAAFPLSGIGPISDRIGLRQTSLLVVAALSLTCYLTSFVNGFTTLVIAFFFLRFLGQGSLSLLGGNTLSMWFRTRLGRVSAVVSIGIATAFAWVPGMISEAIEANGWRATYRLIALCLACTLLPILVLLYRNRPEEIGQQVDGTEDDPHESEPSLLPSEQSLTLSEAARTGSYYVMGMTSAIWAMAGTGVIFYLYTLCADRGFGENVPSDLFKTFGYSMLAMQVFGNIVADFWPVNRLLGLGATVLTLGFAVLAAAKATVWMHVFAVLTGGGQGLLIAVLGVAWVRFYGRRYLGSVRGAVWCATVAGSGCGPLIMGVFKDQTGAYDGAVVSFALLMAPLALASWWVRPPRTKEVVVSN